MFVHIYILKSIQCISLFISRSVIKYTFNMERPGIVPRRRCEEKEIEMVQTAYDKIKHKIDNVINATVWFNIFLNGKFNVEVSDFYSEFDEWVKKLVLTYGKQGQIIHNYGFFFAPKNGSHNQEYHLDYYPQIQTIFIPLVPISAKNATRYLTSYPKSKPTPGKYTTNRFGQGEFQFMEREGIDFVESAQLACKEFTILHLLKNTVHKGIANSADYDRPMFFVSFSPKVENVIYENLIECDVKMITKDEVVE